MTNESLAARIAAYLSGELPEAEAKAFEVEMAATPQLEAEVLKHRKAQLAIERLVEISLKNDFLIWREKLDVLPEPPEIIPEIISVPKRRWPLGLLILLLIIFAGGIWFFLKPLPPGTVPGKNKTLNGHSTDTVTVPPMAKTRVPEDVVPENDKSAPKQIPPKVLFAMAETRLAGFKTSVEKQYGQTMGDNDEPDKFFEAGLKAYQSNDPLTAIQQFRRIAPGNAYYTSAQELLALLYFRKKDYLAAAESYKNFAATNNSPEVDWRLLQFYLADYYHHKTAFWQLANKILKTQGGHPKKAETETLIHLLKSKGEKDSVNK